MAIEERRVKKLYESFQQSHTLRFMEKNKAVTRKSSNIHVYFKV